MKSSIYTCKEKPGTRIRLDVMDDMETPSQVTIRFPDEDFKDYTYWWSQFDYNGVRV